MTHCRSCSGPAQTHCDEHTPHVALGFGGFPFVACDVCAHIYPLADVPPDVVEDCVRALRGGYDRTH